MFGSIAGALGLSTGALTGGLGTAALELGTQYLNNYYSRKAASKANDYNFGMWQAENEYNKPINQMARLEEAGLNPNLVYGGGATTLSARSQGAHEAVQRAPDILGAVGAYQDIKQKDAQTENIKAEKDNIIQQNLNLKQQQKETAMRTLTDAYRLAFYKREAQQELASMEMKNQSDALNLAIAKAMYPGAVREAKNYSDIKTHKILGPALETLGLLTGSIGSVAGAVTDIRTATTPGRRSVLYAR